MNQLIPVSNLSHNQIMTMLEASGRAPKTITIYKRVLDGYLRNGRQFFDRPALAAYADTLSESRKGQLKAAVGLLCRTMMDEVKDLPATNSHDVAQKQQMLWKLEAVQTAVKATAAKGTKVHTWLTAVEVRQLLSAVDGDNVQGQRNSQVLALQNQRDKLALALLVGAGLRREEAVNLTFKDVKLQPIKGKIRSVLQIRGKGAKDRPVPVSDDLAGMIDAWSSTASGSGFVLRSVDGGELGQSLSAVGLFQIVRKHGRAINKPKLAPHDLRRTYAQLGYEAGVPVTQISRLLGHSSIATTQKYLNLELDLETTISDFIPLL